MRNALATILGLLIVYSAVLVVVELSTSQDFVRNYFTDIQGPVPFYAVNTTISVFLLWSTALLFLVSSITSGWCVRPPHCRMFCLSQVAIFGFLGCDDRFKFHEKAAEILGIGDHYVLLATGMMEAIFLVWLGGIGLRRSAARRPLVLAVVLFAVMLFIDACIPHNLVLRLTLEDLSKTWATFCFTLYAWLILMDQLHELRIRPAPIAA